MTYPDTFNPDLLSRIPSDARRVLDVRCGTGALGAEFKRINPTTQVLGIESDADAVAIARRRLDHVYAVDLDTTPLPFAADIDKGSVDCLIYGDTLEHLRDPWSILRQHVEYLSADGLVLVCMPNVEHWSFVERLLKGTFAYQGQGLLDWTHLRWFNADGVRSLLRRSGLVPIDCAPRIFDLPACEDFVDAIAPGLKNLGIDADAYRDRAAPLQHVWRAARKPMGEPMTIVSTMLKPVGGVSEVRVTEPMQALRADPRLLTSVIGPSDRPPLDIEGPRIFIFHRPLLAGDIGIERIKDLIAGGWVVVCEFDDHPEFLRVLQRPDIQNFRGVHAIQTTTDPLAEVLRQYNPEVAAFPNAVRRLPDIANFRGNDHLTMLFAGLNRDDDWPDYIEAINAVADRAGERLRFQVINDRAFFDALRTRHKHFTPLCDYDTYRAILQHCDISFMPLSETPFNRAKSDLKFIEAATFRAVSLASPVVYADSIADGRTGVIFRSPEELRHRLSLLVANPDMARAIGDNARAYVRDERMLAYQIPQRAAWYLDLWNRRDDLHDALLARVPELAD